MSTMKTFEDYLIEVDSENPNSGIKILSEKNYTTKHRRNPTEMSLVHKSVMTDNKHTILKHETNYAGVHTIHHLTPKKRVRVMTITPGTKGRNRTLVHDRPGSPEDHIAYGIDR
jgi:hypothetical protein